MSRRWRRSMDKRIRAEEDRVALERRIAEAIAEDAHELGQHVFNVSPNCSKCQASVAGKQREIARNQLS